MQCTTEDALAVGGRVTTARLRSSVTGSWKTAGVWSARSARNRSIKPLVRRLEVAGRTAEPYDPALMHPLEIEMLMDPKAPDIDALLAELVNRPAWHRNAACRGAGVGLFIIDHGSQYEERSRDLCAGCLVRQECLKVALADGNTTGMWGGTTPTQRRQIRRGRAVA
jgi:WhiB family transcriptional regulator, redox-sensing transcriptional regulator